MVQLLQGSATTIKRRDKKTKERCADCGDPIRLKAEKVVQDGQPYHLLCAGFVHAEKVKPCPTCFIIAPCLCVGV